MFDISLIQEKKPCFDPNNASLTCVWYSNLALPLNIVDSVLCHEAPPWKADDKFGFIPICAPIFSGPVMIKWFHSLIFLKFGTAIHHMFAQTTACLLFLSQLLWP